MSSPSEREIKDYIEEIANKNDQIGKLDKDIKDLCEKLVSLAETLSPQYYAYFLSIYRCLLLHLKVHFGPNFADYVAKHPGYSQLQKLGSLLSVDQSEVQDENCCEDPGSILLKMFSDLVDLKDSPRGTQSHANEVMERARGVFGTLGTKNILRPKVLALVSHNGSWFVEASVAVSPYMRPLVLYTRILHFNWSLQKSVIYFKALEIESNEKWSSSAFCKKTYGEKKDPC